jgi:hypothetical protein
MGWVGVLGCSLLCDCEIALIIFNLHDKPIQYSSRDMDVTLFKFCDMTDQRRPHEHYSNQDVRLLNPSWPCGSNFYGSMILWFYGCGSTKSCARTRSCRVRATTRTIRRSAAQQ